MVMINVQPTSRIYSNLCHHVKYSNEVLFIS